MSLKQRLHNSLTEKVDQQETSLKEIQRNIRKEYRLIDDRAHANVKSYALISRLNENYHTTARQLVKTRLELLDINAGEIEDAQLAIMLPNPEEE